jgi:hypothetical protein
MVRSVESFRGEGKIKFSHICWFTGIEIKNPAFGISRIFISFSVYDF